MSGKIVASLHPVSRSTRFWDEFRARVVVTKGSNVPGISQSSSHQRHTYTPKPKPLSYTSSEEAVAGPPPESGKDRLANRKERQWPARIQVHYDDGIKIRQQSPVIRTIIAETIHRSEAFMIAEDAFPETPERNKFRYITAKKAIKALTMNIEANSDYKEAHRRAKKDANFVHKIGELGVDRLSHHRSEIRAAATTHVAVYQLGVDQICRDRVAALFDGNIFVYDGHWASGQDQEAWVPKRHTAFLNPAIVNTLKSSWFSSERTLGNQHRQLYTSSRPELPGEKEFPIPLVALAATCVHHAISSWRTGLAPVKPPPFKAELVAVTYNTFITSLENSKALKPLEFHHVMNALYTAVCGADSGTGNTGLGDDPLAILDLTGM